MYQLDTKTNAKGKIRQLVRFLGPAFIVSIAYVDPGNFATNIEGGSHYGYSLLWVILCSNLAAIFIQTLSAKLGIATDRSLPQMCGLVFKKSTNWILWVCAELAAMATVLAEFLGGALGFYLLFRIPMIYAGILTAIITVFIVYAGRYGQRVVEAIITIFVAVICCAYAMELFLARPDWGSIAIHILLPSFPDSGALLVAVGMLGATVMPHVIYLHSQLVQCRNNDKTYEKKLKHYKFERLDIIIAMNIAFVVNAAMVAVSAAVFFNNGICVETIEQAHRSLEPLMGALSSGAFGIALLASGLSSAAVGTLAGQTIMKGFVHFDIPLNVIRMITIAPAAIIILAGINPMKALIISQVALSFELPLAIAPLMLITGNRKHMGAFANKPVTNLAGWLITSLIIIMNVALIILLLT